MLHAYLRLLEQRPLRTKMCTSGAIGGISDVVRQAIERDPARPTAWDAERTARQVGFAVALHAPFLHAYHPRLERFFAPWARLRGITVVKTVFDQLLIAPPFLAVFLTVTTLAEGRAPADAGRRLEQQLFPLWQDSVCTWGLAHLVTFNLPVRFRVLWHDVVRLWFGTRMSLRSNAPLAGAEGGAQGGTSTQ